MNVIVPLAFPPPKGKASEKVAPYTIMCAILHHPSDIQMAQLIRQLVNYGTYIKEHPANLDFIR